MNDIDLTKKYSEILSEYSSDASVPITDEEAKKLIYEREKLADDRFMEKIITQEEALDEYFCLLHACDERKFWKDRERILAKIDTKKYDPFKSKNPEIVALAWLRLRAWEAREEENKKSKN